MNAPTWLLYWLSFLQEQGVGENVGPSPTDAPTPALAAQLSADVSWHLTQEGRAAAEMVGEFLPLLDL